MKKIITFLAGLSPNRVAVYVTAAASLATALLPVVTDLGLTEVASVLGGLLAFTAVVSKWLVGWQNMEKAEHQAILIERQRVAALEAAEAERDIVAAAGQAGRGSKLNLPR